MPVFEAANRSAVVFLTVCVAGRRPLLANAEIQHLLETVWCAADYWMVGRYVLMPDHAHVLCAPASRDAVPLARWVTFWKSHTVRRWPRAEEKPVWQRDFWDRQLRGNESFSEKWDYVRNNPVRAGLCERPEDWPYQGEITPFRFHDG